MTHNLKKLGAGATSGGGGSGSVILDGAPVAIESVFATTTYSGSGTLQFVDTGVPLANTPHMTIWQFLSTSAGGSLPIWAPVFDGANNGYILAHPKDGSDNGHPTLTKISNSGAVQWTQEMSISGDNLDALAICCDTVGNAYVAVMPLVEQNLVIIAFNTSGAVLWQTTFSLSSGQSFNTYDTASPCQLSVSTGSLIAVIGANTTQNCLVTLKLNPTTGAQIWQTSYAAATAVTGVAVTEEAGTFFVGFGTVTDGGIVAMLDSSGGVTWASALTVPSSTVSISSISRATDTFGAGLNIAGNVSDLTSGNTSGILLQITDSGSEVWQHTLSMPGLLVSGPNYSLAYGHTDTAGNVYVGSNVDSPTFTTILMQYNSSGALQWEYVYNYRNVPSVANRLTGIGTDNSNSLYLAINASAGYDGGVVKLSPTDAVLIGSTGPLIDTTSGINVLPTTLSVLSVTVTVSTGTVVVTTATNITTSVGSVASGGSQGGLLWIKDRLVGGGATNHAITDTVRGPGTYLETNDTTLALDNVDQEMVTAFSPIGFYLGDDGGMVNDLGESYVSWTFARQPKFFDIVEYVGNGTTQNITHGLTIAPGAIVVKAVSAAGNWPVYHNGLPGGYSFLNTTDPAMQATNDWWASLNNTCGCDVVAVDSAGNIYVGNNEYGYVPVLAKYSAAGALLWENTLSASGSTITDICIDSSDNIYVGYGGGGSGMVFQYSSAGAILWQRVLPNASTITQVKLALDGLGNLYVAGGAYGATVASESYLSKYTTGGVFVWQKQFNLTNIGAVAVDVSNTGNIYVCGNAHITGTQFGWVGAFSSTGAVLWEQEVTYNGVIFNDLVVGVNAASPTVGAGYVYVVGSAGTLAYLIAFSAAGTAEYQDTLIFSTSPSTINALLGVCVDQYKDLYVTGTLSSTSPFASGVVIKYTANGQSPIWAQMFNNSSGAFLVTGRSIVCDTVGGVIVAASLYQSGGPITYQPSGAYGGLIAYLQQDGSAAVNTSIGATAWSAETLTYYTSSFGLTGLVGGSTITAGALTFAAGGSADSAGALITAGVTLSIAFHTMYGSSGETINYFGDNTNVVAPTSTQFTVGNAADVNASGVSYIAYLFAHDPSPTGLIQCGSYASVVYSESKTNLGWEPQFILGATVNYTTAWEVSDTARGMAYTGYNPALLAATPYSDVGGISAPWLPFEDGFLSHATPNHNTVMYIAIRRAPMTFPTSGLAVYNAAIFTGTGAANDIEVGFDPDLVIFHARAATQAISWYTPMYGDQYYLDSSTNGYVVSAGTGNGIAVTPTGFTLSATTTAGENTSGRGEVAWCFKRNPGVFDLTLFGGNSVGFTETVSHELGVIPELIIIKNALTFTGITSPNPNWYIYHKDLGISQALSFTSAAAVSGDVLVSLPTTIELVVQNLAASGTVDTFIGYFFASLAGVSKVGSYTGNGTLQTINCGFTNSARFVMIKRTDAVGDWFIWDSTRGIYPLGTYGPYSNMDSSTDPEDYSNASVAPASTGFVVSEDVGAASINVTGGQYIYLALA